MDASSFIEGKFMVPWFVVFIWFAVFMAILLPIAWFLLPSAKARLEAGLRRPAEPDTLEADIGLFRWLSFILMYFFWLMLMIFVSAHASVTPREKELQLTTALPTAETSSTSMPAITISAEGDVAFLDLHLPPSDHDLDALRLRLRELVPLLKEHEPALIQPEPEATHQRIIEVLSAVQRAGVGESILQ